MVNYLEYGHTYYITKFLASNVNRCIAFVEYAWVNSRNFLEVF